MTMEKRIYDYSQEQRTAAVAGYLTPPTLIEVVRTCVQCAADSGPHEYCDHCFSEIGAGD